MLNSRKYIQIHSAYKLAEYLNKQINENNSYMDLPTWGYSFSALFNYSLNIFKNEQEIALKLLHKQDLANKEFSWEFVIFAALIMSQCNETKAIIPKEFLNYREKGTRMFNWFLLRCHNKILLRKDKFNTLIKLKIALQLYQTKEGLILDEFKTRSLHYHAFCLFILAHIIKIHDTPWLRISFERGIKYSLQHILKDGTSLYIGRGQEQIFGYGALLYSLEFYNSNFTPLKVSILDSVTDKITRFQRLNGSFPLVLRNIFPEKENINFKDNQPYGWYGYNTLYDYLPFLGYCMSEAAKFK